MALKRGFLAEANKYALDFRNELQLLSHAPLCPWQLAEHLEIPILPISKLKILEESHLKFFQKSKCPVSAATLPINGIKRGIVFNDYHAENRQSSSIAHEIAHIILKHNAGQIMHADGTRNFDSALEEEASNLGAILQIPDNAALHILEQEISIPKACIDYKVSSQLMEWRMNKSGARKILAQRVRKKELEAL